jgi:hypothetical protein
LDEKMKTEIIKITPELASVILSKNVNRKVRPHQVNALKESMLGGLWRLTHQGIAFDVNGNLVDGQHRLLAIVASKMTFDMMVTHYDSAFQYDVLPVDTGSYRNYSDLTGLPQGLTELASGYHSIVLVDNRAVKIPAHIIKDEAMIIKPFLDKLTKYCGTTARQKSVFAVKGAACLMMARYPEREGYILESYRQYILDVQDMPKPLYAIQKALIRGVVTNNGHSAQKDYFARVWLAFNPQNTDLSRIQISNLDRVIDDAIAAWHHVFKKQ